MGIDDGQTYVEVFSAHAEVVPKFSDANTPTPRILRARGGSSHRPVGR